MPRRLVGVFAIPLMAFTSIMSTAAGAAPDGTLDGSFGSGGTTITDLAFTESPTDIAVQPDGKILVFCVSSTSPGGDLVLIRYDANGIPDPTFDGDGIVITDVGASTTDASGSMAIQPDGKIIASAGAFRPEVCVRSR